MELVIAIISLMWVVGILSLQRIDSVVNEFTQALAYYLSLGQNGAIDPTQLNLKASLTKTALIDLVKKLVAAGARWDLLGLRKSLLFFKIAERVKGGFEVLLIAATLLLPLVYLIDFSRLDFVSFADKDAVLYLAFFSVVLMALGTEKVLSYFSGKLYPLKAQVGQESDRASQS